MRKLVGLLLVCLLGCHERTAFQNMAECRTICEGHTVDSFTQYGDGTYACSCGRTLPPQCADASAPKGQK